MTDPAVASEDVSEPSETKAFTLQCGAILVFNLPLAYDPRRILREWEAPPLPCLEPKAVRHPQKLEGCKILRTWSKAL